ncbi:YndJ family transporter [Euzebya tangerina]|uniref:YndJ family transporter n=1 Tax=Euzebya tangerina TaxID=591198 RepID=UPI000E30CA60|nr:YndJ family transporter [Euzebya tangerina]
MVAVHVLLILALVGVVPLALRLTGHPSTGRQAVLLALLAAPSLLLPPSPWAVLLAVPWVVLAGATTVQATAATIRDLRGRPEPHAREGLLVTGAAAVAATSAPAYWTVGAAWLVLDRAAADPLAVGPAIVTLTAIHFHYAGFASIAILAATTRLRAGARSRALALATIGVVLGSPLVAIGFAVYRPAQIAGAVVLTLSLWLWAVAAGPVRTSDRSRRALWALSRCSVFVGMPLATWWAIGSVTGVWAPTIPTMALTHGVVQGVGFVLCALLVLTPMAQEQPHETRMSQGHAFMGTVGTYVR